MGAHISKAAGKDEAAVEKPAEGAAVAAKANGQVDDAQPLLIVEGFFVWFVQRVTSMACSAFPAASPRSPAFQGKWRTWIRPQGGTGL